MRALRIVVAAALALFLLWPEVRAYHAEHELVRYDAIASAVRRQPALASDPRVRAALTDARRLDSLPGDWRPAYTAGSLFEATGDLLNAEESFRRAAAIGERPEVNVRLASILAATGREARARELLTRAIWISPAVAPYTTDLERRRAEKSVGRLAYRLKVGTLRESDFPPPP